MILQGSRVLFSTRWFCCFSLITSAMAKVMFSSLSVALSVCLSVCLSICLSVCLLATLRKTGWTDFHDICIQYPWYKEQLGTFSGCSIQPLEHRIFHLTFSEQSMPFSSIAEKRLNGFSLNFQKKTDMTQGAIWNIFGMLQLTPWILGWFIYFLDPCLFVILWKNGWTDFHEIFMKRQAWHKKQSARLFHTCLDCLTVSHLGVLGVFVSNTTVESICGFSWNFHDILAMIQETIWKILGIIGLTPWTPGSFFYFLGPCLLATSPNTGWMDSHEIFRIWTQEAIGFSVWRLSRLFHAKKKQAWQRFELLSECFLFIQFSFCIPHGYQVTLTTNHIELSSVLPSLWPQSYRSHLSPGLQPLQKTLHKKIINNCA